MEDIILGGVSIAVLKEQKKAIQKDAVKFVSNNVEQAIALLDKIVEESEQDTPEGLREMCTETLSLLKNAELVADISGVTYSLPWDFDYNTPYSSKMEGMDWDKLGVEDILNKLCCQLEDMENEVRGWEESTC